MKQGAGGPVRLPGRWRSLPSCSGAWLASADEIDEVKSLAAPVGRPGSGGDGAHGARQLRGVLSNGFEDCLTPRRRRRGSRTGRWSRSPPPPGSGVRTGCWRPSARGSRRRGIRANLTTLHPIAAGDMYGIKGVDHIAKDGLLSTIIGGSYPSGPSSLPMPEIWRMLTEDRVAAYNVPSGILFDMHRDAAARRPGVLTQVGLDTFVDPIREGCAMNATRRGAADRQPGRVRRRDLAALSQHHPRRRDPPGDDGGRARQPHLRARRRLSRRAGAGDLRAQPRRARHRAGEAGDGGGVAAAA